MLLEMCDSVKYFYSLQTNVYHHIQCDHLTPYQIQCISPMGINKCFLSITRHSSPGDTDNLITTLPKFGKETTVQWMVKYLVNCLQYRRCMTGCCSPNRVLLVRTGS